MFEVELLDNLMEMLYYPIREGFESTIFLTEYDNYAKIFKPYVPDEIRLRKQRMIISLHFSDLCDNHNMIPETYRLVYTNDGQFSGYFMVPVPGIALNDYMEKCSTQEKLTIFKNLQENIKILNNHGYCLSDFNPANILVSNDLSLRFVDIDSFCFINDSAKNIFSSYKYVCPYSKVIGKKYNNYSFYALVLDMLFGVNKKDNKRKQIIEIIEEADDLPDDIKDKLIYFTKIRNRLGLLKLTNLF
jgi:serine/threonine protein kinase